MDTDVKTLTAQDRCDRCSAQATGWATFEGGYELLFCTHHLRKFTNGLLESGAEVWHREPEVVDTKADAVVP